MEEGGGAEMKRLERLRMDQTEDRADELMGQTRPQVDGTWGGGECVDKDDAI
jgi:hypothetical protein